MSPYLESIGSDYSHGANFASSASTVIPPFTSFFHSGLSPFSLSIQLSQMRQFKARVDEFHKTGTQKIFTTDLHLLNLIMVHSPMNLSFHACTTQELYRHLVFLHQIYSKRPFTCYTLAKMISLPK